MNAAIRLRKLRSMSGAELRTRLAAAAYRVYERRALRAPAGQNPPAIFADRNGASSASTAAPRFLASVDDLTATRAALETHYQQELGASIDRADRMLRGEFTLFGQHRQLGQVVDWHADPIMGGRWPLLYHADVPIGDRMKAPGDAKDVWELNRQQFLVDLAKAWFVTGRSEYVAKIDQLVLSWIGANPYGFGVNWSGPLEVGYRALSWLWAYHLTGNRPIPDSTRSAWLASFHDHGRFLFHHLELYESPYNHLISESSVLYILGVMFPGFRDAARWRARGRRVLESRLSEQFYADGGSVEQATVYHHATLGFYLLAAIVARRNHQDLSPAVWAALERAIDYSMHLTQPDGRLPAIGDNDDARPLAFDVRDNWDYRHFLAAGAALFGRSDFKAIAGRMPEDAFWLLGPEGLIVFSAVADIAAPRRSHILPASGYAVLRATRGGAEDYVCFDCGEQAGGLRCDDVPSAAHGHADALSVVACLDGQPILVDAGFYTYDGERSWERYFRETAAHNTVRVDRTDQARHLDKMSWSRVPSVTIEGFHSGAAGSWAVASHDGYERHATGVRHRRSVWLRPDGSVILYDELTGRGEHTAEVIFQFHEELATILENERLVIGGRFVLISSATAALERTVHHGDDRADGGWIAPRLGARTPAARFVMTATFADTLRVLTTIADGRQWTHMVASHDRERSTLVHQLSTDSVMEIVGASAGAGVTAGHHTTDGAIGVWREEFGRLVEAARIGGTFITPGMDGGPLR
jgi:hypothetical protein